MRDWFMWGVIGVLLLILFIFAGDYRQFVKRVDDHETRLTTLERSRGGGADTRSSGEGRDDPRDMTQGAGDSPVGSDRAKQRAAAGPPAPSFTASLLSNLGPPENIEKRDDGTSVWWYPFKGFVIRNDRCVGFEERGE